MMNRRGWFAAMLAAPLALLCGKRPRSSDSITISVWYEMQYEVELTDGRTDRVRNHEFSQLLAQKRVAKWEQVLVASSEESP